MTNSEKVVCLLVANAINEGYNLNPEDFRNADWSEVLRVAVKQSVVGLTFDAIELLPENLRPDGRVILKWIGYVAQLENAYSKHKETIFNLADFYAEHGFAMMLLKGYGVSSCWPVPQHRPTGDIDIFLGKKDASPVFCSMSVWKEADKVLKDVLGIRIDNGYHHHSVYKFQGIMVENHYNFINTYSHRSGRSFESLLKQLASDGYKTHPECDNLYLPSDDFNALFLLKHCSAHFASTEMNLRQILDWLLFAREHHDTIDWKNLYSTLKDYGLEKFANILSAIGVYYFGMSPESFYSIEDDHEIVQRVLNDIFSPEFQEREKGTLLSGLWVKPRRFYHNRWKYRLCYRDSLVSGFLWSSFAKIIKPKHFKQ